jgi:fermentation-respiration switch protein FrsA (DUF1100 family)
MKRFDYALRRFPFCRISEGGASASAGAVSTGIPSSRDSLSMKRPAHHFSKLLWLLAAMVVLASGTFSLVLFSFRHNRSSETWVAKTPLAKVFAGDWDTQVGSNKYRMTLKYVNGAVSGSYSGATSGTVTGTVDNAGRLIFSWTESNHTGTGIFVLSSDRSSFTGHYSNNSDPTNVTGPWTGTRH